MGRLEEIERQYDLVTKNTGIVTPFYDDIGYLLSTIHRQKLIINSLVERVRLCHEKHGSEYLGGRPFQFILDDIKFLEDD